MTPERKWRIEFTKALKHRGEWICGSNPKVQASFDEGLPGLESGTWIVDTWRLALASLGGPTGDALQRISAGSRVSDDDDEYNFIIVRLGDIEEKEAIEVTEKRAIIIVVR